MTKRTVLLWIAGAVVLAGSTTAAVLAAQDGDTTTSAVCVPVDDTDRDKAGLADHVAVVMVDHRVKEQPNETNVEVFSQIRVEETLKGGLAAQATVDQVVFRAPGGGFKATGPHREPLTAGHRYVIGVDDWGGTGSPKVQEVLFATPADGDRLGQERARWQDAITHQTRRAPGHCNDVVGGA
ncbi:hypothetical protein ACWGI1_39620 [Streptomyces sp. NPDC054835]